MNAKLSYLLIVIKLFFRHLRVNFGAVKRKIGFQDKQYLHLKNLKNAYEDKRCFVVCTGPSLTLDDVNMLKGEYTFSMNSIFKLYTKTDWRQTFYCIIDPYVYKDICNNVNFKTIKNAFVPDYLVEKYGTSILGDYILFPMDTFEIYRHRLTKRAIRFSEDIYSVVYDVSTAVYTILQLAVYMGFKEIYLLGCDCDYSGSKKHFESEKYEKNVPNDVEQKMIIAYKAAKAYADTHNIKIYNATRGGKLEVFERVDFDSLFPPEA